MIYVGVIQTVLLALFCLGVVALLVRDQRASTLRGERLLTGLEHVSYEIAKEHETTRELVANTSLIEALEVNTRTALTEAVR